MELLLVLSKETNNSVAEMLKMPSHFVVGMYNALRRILDKEAKARKEAEEKQSKGMSTPSMPHINIPSMPKFK
jgi:hypothetical protein